MDHRFNASLSDKLQKKMILFSAIFVLAGMLISSVQSTAATVEDTTTTSDSSIEITTTTTVETTATTTTPVTTTQVTYTAEQIKYFDVMRVNNRTYNWGDPDPAMATFRTVAKYRGWSAQQIQSWEVAVYDIMKGESGFCPNMLGGARIAKTQGCIIARQGRRSDAGFGQLISIHYRYTRPGTGWLCKQEGLCSKWQIVGSPWNSMTALLALIERSGTHGWCYSRSARAHHRVTCSNPGLDV